MKHKVANRAGGIAAVIKPALAGGGGALGDRKDRSGREGHLGEEGLQCFFHAFRSVLLLA